MKYPLSNSLLQQIGVVRCLYVLSMVYQISSSMFVSVSLSLWFSLEYFSPQCVHEYCTYLLFSLFNCMIIIHSLVFRMISSSFSLLLSSRISCACVRAFGFAFLFFSYTPCLFFSLSVFLCIVFVALI